MSKKVIVNGACGRMGQEVVKTICQDTEDKLVGVCDQKNIGKNIMTLLGLEEQELIIQSDLSQLIKESKVDVVIDFTTPRVVMENIETALSLGVHIIVGTTGITDVDLAKIKKLTKENQANAMIVPNFAIGAILMMRYAADAAKYLNEVEIIELHHEQKIDAPSGTALKTAELIKNNLLENKEKVKVDEIEKLTGARGGDKDGIKIHSVRLQGLVAHQEVIFGAEGQSLKIRHDSYNRKSFMPGVRLALNKINEINGLVYGLEKLLD